VTGHNKMASRIAQRIRKRINHASIKPPLGFANRIQFRALTTFTQLRLKNPANSALASPSIGIGGIRHTHPSAGNVFVSIKK